MPDTTIALIDDDRNILTSLTFALEAEGYRVCAWDNGLTALQALAARAADLVVLDIKMPRMDGFEALAKLRDFCTAPVIFLTSKDTDMDEVEGLERGADDYIRKPFSQKLLLSRIRVLLRRATPSASPVEGRQNVQMTRGHLLMDERRHLCLWKGREVALTVTEFLILKALATRPGHVKSRNRLIDDAYGTHIYVDDRTIDSHIKRMRRKFKRIDPQFSGIETLYGIGYRYCMGSQN